MGEWGEVTSPQKLTMIKNCLVCLIAMQVEFIHT